MTREEFRKKFSQSYLDELIEAAFQAIRKNKKVGLIFTHSTIIENYDCSDDTTTCEVKVYYYNGHEHHTFALIEQLFSEQHIMSDDINGANKITNYKTKFILRIAGRIGRHELRAGSTNGMN